jgi:exodeoxyribonuclease VII large subunit
MALRKKSTRPKGATKRKIKADSLVVSEGLFQLGLFDAGNETEMASEASEAESRGAIESPSAFESQGAVQSRRAVEAQPVNVKKTHIALEESPPQAEKPNIYSVSDLASAIKDSLREKFGSFAVQGEICDFKGIHRNGHLYCGLKDENSQIRMVMWRGALQKLPFEIRQGLEVVVTGKLDFYGASGALQISADRIEPLGIGALQLRFEQLKEKLKGEGLFDPSRKKTIPPVAWRVGIVTGRSTAALQDMLRIFKQRFPIAEIFLFHAAVQGKSAPEEISAAIECANRFSKKTPLDALIIGRGGGSYEDLFCFNDEGLARVIAHSEVPTISAVGHEIDFTIADFVADRRAATPSHAVQELVPEGLLWIQRLQEIEARMLGKLEDIVANLRVKVDHLMERLIQAAPHKRLQHQREILKGAAHRIYSQISRILQAERHRVGSLAVTLEAISPLKSFDRGWAMATDSSGRLVQSIREVNTGDKIKIRLKNGTLTSLVESVQALKN